MKSKIFTFMLLLSIAAVGAWAQNLPANIWSSPQSTTTEGRYRSNADDFIRPDSWTGVKFDKWFGMVSFLWNDAFDAIATAGFATKVSNVYLGAFYTGNLWAGIPVNNYTEMETTPTGGSTGNHNVYDSISVIGDNNVNNAALIVGIADMGFRLTYRTNYQFFDKNDIVVGTPPGQLYKSYQAEKGYIAPQIAWAMAKDLTANGIRPYATVDLVFDRDYQKTETSGPDSDSKTGEKIERSLNHFDPILGLGLDGYTFFNNNGFKGSFDVDYVLTFNIYDNEYSFVDGDNYKTGKINGTYSPGNNPYMEQFFVSNMLTPSVSGSWSKDRLALKFKLNLPLALLNQEQNLMALNSSNDLVYDGASKATMTFVFRPDLRLALQYKLVPDRLTLNAGARIQATAIYLETLTQTNYTNGTKNSTQKIHQDSFTAKNDPFDTNSNASFASRFSLGAAFNFTENVWVEATTGVTNKFGNEETIEIFAPGGLFSFGSILVSLKF